MAQHSRWNHGVIASVFAYTEPVQDWACDLPSHIRQGHRSSYYFLLNYWLLMDSGGVTVTIFSCRPLLGSLAQWLAPNPGSD